MKVAVELDIDFDPALTRENATDHDVRRAVGTIGDSLRATLRGRRLVVPTGSVTIGESRVVAFGYIGDLMPEDIA